RIFWSGTGHRAVAQARRIRLGGERHGRRFNVSIVLELSTVHSGRDLYLWRVAERAAAYRIDRAVRRARRFQRAAGAFRGTNASGAALSAAADRSAAEF